MNPGGGHLDLVVVGSGVAGLSAAVRAADLGLAVGVVTKGQLDQATTRWAQGGIAAVLGGDPDSTDLHLADTLSAGAGLCDERAVRILVDEGPGRVLELIARGAEFDRDERGALDLAREGGHSTARVVHAGGAATGVEIERALVEAVEATATVLLERWFAVDLVVDGGRCTGVVAIDGDHVVLVRQYRPALDREMLELPAGKLDVPGESLVEAARRELIEEAGLDAPHLVEVAGFHNSGGFCDEFTTVFLATELVPAEARAVSVEEAYLTVERVPLDDVPAMIADGTLTDAKTVIGLLAVLRHLGR